MPPNTGALVKHTHTHPDAWTHLHTYTEHTWTHMRTHTHVDTPTYTQTREHRDTPTHMNMWAHTDMHACTRTCEHEKQTHACKHACTRTRLHVWTRGHRWPRGTRIHTWTCEHMRTRGHAYMCEHASTHVNTRVHIHVPDLHRLPLRIEREGILPQHILSGQKNKNWHKTWQEEPSN